MMGIRYPDHMEDRPLSINNSPYVLLPSVTHPQGRARAFADTFKAVVRFLVEVTENLIVAYAIEKTDRIVTAENLALLSDEDLEEWDAACAEFEAMPPHQQRAWVERVRATYPRLETLPDLDYYNHLQ